MPKKRLIGVITVKNNIALGVNKKQMLTEIMDDEFFNIKELK